VNEVREKTPVSAHRSAGGAEPLSPIAALVRRHDRDRYQTALFAPAARREALFALYAFNFEIARVRETVTQPTLGRIRLEWWRENIGTAYDGGPVRRHPVAEALTAAIRCHRLSRAHFDRLVDAREADFDDEPPATLAALEDYAEATASTLILLALEALGVREPAAAAAGRHVGVAFALTGLLRAIPFHAGRWRPIVPADVAARSGLDARGSPVGPGSRALRAAVGEIAKAAAGHLRQARNGRRAVPRRALPALLPAVVAGQALRRLAHAGNDPFAPTLARPDPLQSWQLAAAALLNRF
jgi:phytoene synthase